VEKHTNPAFFPSALVVFGNLDGKQTEKLNDIGIWMETAVKPIPPPSKDGGILGVIL